MKDRYLFKAKTAKIVDTYNNDVEDGVWVHGSLRCDVGKYTIFQFETERADYVEYEIDPTTICQCTGLKDKNGKLIWENDILMCYDNTDNLVKVAYGEFDVIDADSLNVSDSVIGWHHEVVSMDTLNKYELLCYDMLPLTEYYIQLMESKRIGNIFDNPELLESEE